MIKFYDDVILLKPEPVEPVRTVKKSHLAKDERRYTCNVGATHKSKPKHWTIFIETHFGIKTYFEILIHPFPFLFST